MNRKHIAILRRLCAARAFMVAEKRSNGTRKVTLVENWTPSRLSICQETLINWLRLDYISPSEHTSESYYITDAGRAFVARFDPPDVPLTMTSIMRVQALVRSARSEATR
jgi:hypothetical protein